MSFSVELYFSLQDFFATFYRSCKFFSHFDNKLIKYLDSLKLILLISMYSVFTINVPLAVRFATVAIGMRKAESPEYCRFGSHLH